MKTVVYRKSDLRCVSTIPSNKTAEGDINITVIPNFGGSIEDYAVIETDKQNFHLKDVSGDVVVVENDVPVSSEPVDEEKVWMAEALIQQDAEIEELKARLIAAGL